MLRRLGIRAKVLAVLAVPIIVLLMAGSYISANAIQKAQMASASSRVVATLNAYAPLSATLQTERALSTETAIDKDALATARTATDKALEAVKPFTASVDLNDFPAVVVQMFYRSQQAHNVDLLDVRRAVDTDTSPTVILNKYNAIIASEIDLVGEIAQVLDDRGLAGYIKAYHSLAQTAESLVTEWSQGLQIIGSRAQSASAARAFATQNSTTEVYRTALHIDIDAIGNPALTLSSADPTSSFTRERLLISSSIAGATIGVDAADWSTSIQTQVKHLSAFQGELLGKAIDVANANEATERNTALATIAASVLATVLSLLFALVVSRSIVIPLRRLTAATAEVREQLPTLVEQMAVPGQGPSLELVQIPVTSNDEVGKLAASFNAVNSTTLQIAQEQAALRGSIAEMFINVARRDQVLLNRQLSFIDSLERSEEDPNALANLFRLDHLATRMRRNAESLLVLAGIDTGRRVRDAMPLSDVVRTASSEIEQYDRIELELAVDPQMHGFNALGAAHLLAELFENATVFSEPETPVEVKTGVLGDHVVVQIVDHGLGMSTTELEAANLKIRSTSAADSLGEQRLGLFVVGRIANRLGASVVLSKGSTGTGTVTTVRFPATLFETTEGALYGSRPVQSAAQLQESVAADAPLAEAVDLAMLTDGETSLGLPRRRQRSDEDPAEISLPGARAPQGRPGKTFDESKIVLPGLAEATLAPELSSHGPDWAPAVTAAPSGGGLPSRSRATSAWAPEEIVPEVPAAPAAREARAGLFSGFRTRAELPTPAPADVVEVPQQHAESGPPAAFTIPGLAPEDDGSPYEEAPVWAPTWAEAAEPLLAAAPAIEPGAPADLAGGFRGYDQNAVEPVEAWAPVQAWDEPAAEQPAAFRSIDHGAHVATPDSWDAPAAAWSDAPVQGVDDEAVAVHVEQDEHVAELSVEQIAEPVKHADWHAVEPVDHDEWPVAEPTPESHVVTPPSSYSEFSAFSGYDDRSSRYSASSRSDFAPIGFGPVLDEARAWNAGEPHHEPVAVPEPTSSTHDSAQPVAEQSAWAGAAADHTWDVPAPAPSDTTGNAPEAAWDAPAAEAVWEAPTPAASWDAPVTQSAWQMPVSETTWSEPDGEAQWTAPEVAPHQASWTIPALVEDEPEQPQAPEPVQPSAPTERLDPVEAELAAESAAREPDPFAAPHVVTGTPAWAATPPPAAQPAPDFTALLQGSPAAAAKSTTGRRKWSLFGKRKADESTAPAAVSASAPASSFTRPFEQTFAPAPVTEQPQRASAWSATAPAAPVPAAPAPFIRPNETFPSPEQAPTGLPEVPEAIRKLTNATWSPPSEPVEQAVVHGAPHQVGSFFGSRTAPTRPAAPAPTRPAAPAPTRPAAPASWSPDQAPRAAETGGQQPASQPLSPHRIGALDDEVAAMLALRSDIQEQALSELSQLSAYRPSAPTGGSASASLAKRVPQEIPASPEFVQAAAGTPDRDAEQLRSRFASYQSGTARGRQAVVEPAGPATLLDDDAMVDTDQATTPPAPSW
ncbi:MAG: nitrate- and nitrite sensing domain-containing protein [Cellulomonas sp.]